MNLEELYQKAGIGERITKSRNILAVCAEKDDDALAPYLASLGLSPDEVAVTWPKDGITVEEEAEAYGAEVVLDVHKPVTDELFERVIEAGRDWFVNLHHHDEFSIKDGLGTVEQLCSLLRKQKRSYCCVTNHGGVGGWIRQYNACKKAGVKAIFGMEAYVNDYRGDDPELRKANKSANHLVLLAATEEGRQNIIRIHNDAQLNGFYYTPRANREAFKKWGKGIFATSACLAGEIPRLLMDGDEDKALETYRFYASCFDRFFLEIQLIELEEQREANRRVIKFAEKVGCPIVLACDSHYLDPSYSDTHEILMLSRQKKTLQDAREKDDTWTFDVKNLYYRNFDQMYDLFKNGWRDANGEHKPFEDEVFTKHIFALASKTTTAIARLCAKIELDSAIHLPQISEDSKKQLSDKINAGFKKRGLNKLPNVRDYIARAQSEYEIVTRLGWTDYFLIVERIVSDAKEKYGSYALGWGRGSGGGSLICYCLGITDADPLKYNLLFERFIDESRGGVFACSFEA